MKYSDVFNSHIVGFPPYWSDAQVRYAGNALAQHDRLTAQVEELKGVINENLIPRLDAEFEATDDGIIYMIREEINQLLTRIGEDDA